MRAQRHSDHLVNCRMPACYLGKRRLDQPVYFGIRIMAAQIADGREQVKDVAQGRQLYDENFHFWNICNFRLLSHCKLKDAFILVGARIYNKCFS